MTIFRFYCLYLIWTKRWHDANTLVSLLKGPERT
jgi:hypothetical protein